MENNIDYTIEQLEKTFKEHAEKNIRNHERDVESFKIKYPDSELPEHLKNDFFNISEALHVICREINRTQNYLRCLLDDEELKKY